MAKSKLLASGALLVLVPLLAYAQEAPQAPPEPYGPPPGAQGIPPHVEGQAEAVAGGGFCYGGAHPVDTRVAAGSAWDETSGTHQHTYPPFDLRLFSFRDGCYYFVGDPTDFGYRGRTYSYWGAHPVLDGYGGGWCFMIGGHGHMWEPWSPYFVMTGPWHYWYGPYDAFFWGYYPYWAHYYRSYYPHYYAGGRFSRGRDVHVAPPITSVPPPSAANTAASGMPAAASGSTPGWRGGTAPAEGRSALPSWRTGESGNRTGVGRAPRFYNDGNTITPSTVPSGQPMRLRESTRAAESGDWRSSPGSWGGGGSPAPSFRSAPTYSAPPRQSAPSAPSFRSAPSSGGGGGSVPSFRRR